jgi:putative toxin-antitoxin system antitoxin component (TIGR02293 family)
LTIVVVFATNNVSLWDKRKDMETMEIFDPMVAYGSVDEINSLSLVNMVRRGIGFKAFDKFANKSPFSLNEWSTYLHLSERTMQRYRSEQKTFDPLQSEKIIEIALFYNKGIEVFGSAEKFNSWLDTDNLALGKIKPKMLLDNSFGINMLRDELTAIEYGILA